MFKTLLLSVVVVSGCSKSKSKGDDPSASASAGSAPATATTTPPVADAPAAVPPIAAPTGLFTCKAPAAAAPAAPDAKNPWALPFAVSGCPSIPPIYGTATFGMDAATAAKAVKGSKVTGDAGYLYVGKSPFRQQFAFRFSEKGALETFAFKIDEAGFAQLQAAWGEPVSIVDGRDKMFAWYDPAKKIRVTAKVDEWDRANAATRKDETVAGYYVYVTPYLPLADLLGPEGMVAKPFVGKTVTEVAAAYPDYLEATTKEQAKEKLDKLGLDKDTVAKAEALGAGGASVNLELPPTETNRHNTLVQTEWADGKVKSYSFALPFGKDETLKREILAQVAAAFGKPTAASEKEYTFAGRDNTVVLLRLGILEQDWRLEVEPKR